MSWLDDALNFEMFNAGDMWKKIKKNPERLLLGAGEPASSKLWGSILGKDYEPLVDQMGGAYGGHWLSSFGNKDGGVYGRATQAGIDTQAGGSIQDLAHVIAAMYAGNYGTDKLGIQGNGMSRRIPNQSMSRSRGGELQNAQDLLEAILIAQNQMPWSEKWQM